MLALQPSRIAFIEVKSQLAHRSGSNKLFGAQKAQALAILGALLAVKAWLSSVACRCDFFLGCAILCLSQERMRRACSQSDAAAHAR